MTDWLFGRIRVVGQLLWAAPCLRKLRWLCPLFSGLLRLSLHFGQLVLRLMPGAAPEPNEPHDLTLT
jgi:hypothetical protein